MAANPANIIVVPDEDLGTRAARITAYNRNRSWQTRWPRWEMNLRNWDAYHHRMDYSHKKEFQSRMTIADFGMAVEQTVGILERGLTDTDDFMNVESVGIGDPIIQPDVLKSLLMYYLRRLWVPGDKAETSRGIAQLIGDGVKRGILEAILTAKIYARQGTKYRYTLEYAKPVKGDTGHREDLPAYDMTRHGRPKVKRHEDKGFRLAIDLVPFEDYFPDPSLHNIFEIHEVTRTIQELFANPDYDPDVIKGLAGTANATLADMYKRRVQNEPFVQHDPFEIRVQEVWGDLIDTDGTVLATNSFWTCANGKLLRPPTPNPFLHGKRPFVSCALIPTPNSTTHKALADEAVPIWEALNEQFSLMTDGGLGAVWGKHQIRQDVLENPEDFGQGIPQDALFMLKSNVPEGTKAVERIDSGETPAYGLEMFHTLLSQFQVAMASNDLKMGQLPPRETKATEIIEAQQASGSVFEAIAARVEVGFLEPAFELAWQVILQYETEEKLTEPALVQILGPQLVLQLARLTPEERFVFLQEANFTVRGLRGVAARNRTMTRLLNLVQIIGQNPELGLQDDISMPRLGQELLKNSGTDPSKFAKSDDEKAQDAADAQAQQQQQQAEQGGAGAPQKPDGSPAEGGGGGGGSPPALVENAGEQPVASQFAPKTPGPAQAG